METNPPFQESLWPLRIFLFACSLEIILLTIIITFTNDYTGILPLIICTAVATLSAIHIYKNYTQTSMFKFIALVTLIAVLINIGILLQETTRDGHQGSMADIILIGLGIILVALLIVGIIIGAILNVIDLTDIAKKRIKHIFTIIMTVLILIPTFSFGTAVFVTGSQSINENNVDAIFIQAQTDLTACAKLRSAQRIGGSLPEDLTLRCYLTYSNFTDCTTVPDEITKNICISLQQGKAVSTMEGMLILYEYPLQGLALLAKGTSQGMNCQQIEQLISADAVFNYSAEVYVNPGVNGDKEFRQMPLRAYFNISNKEARHDDICEAVVNDTCTRFDSYWHMGIPFCERVREAAENQK